MDKCACVTKDKEGIAMLRQLTRQRQNTKKKEAELKEEMHSNEKTAGTTIENLIILEDDFIAVQFFDVCVLCAVLIAQVIQARRNFKR